MSDQPNERQPIDWQRSCPVLELLRGFRMAIHPGKLILCFLGLNVTFWLGVLVDRIPGIGRTAVNGQSFFENLYGLATRGLWGAWEVPYVTAGASWDSFLVFLLKPVSALWALAGLVFQYWVEETWFALVMTVVTLGVWAMVGGAVTRMAAVRFAREESVPVRPALGFACRKWPSLVSSPLIPFGVLVLLALGVGLVSGPLMMVPYLGEVLVPLLFFLTLILGLVMAVVFLGGCFSVGLQWPTIAVEGSDAFDALSRSVAYIAGRPWRYLFYTLFSAVYGCLTFLFVKLVAFLTLWLTHKAVGWLTWGGGEHADKLVRMWAEPSAANPMPVPGGETFVAGAEMMRLEMVGHVILTVWIWVFLGMVIAFLASFALTTQTIIYFLLRRNVDATDIEEVYLEEESDLDEALPISAPPPPEGETSQPGEEPEPAPDETPEAEAEGPPEDEKEGD